MNNIEAMPITSSFKLLVAPEEQELYDDEVEKQVSAAWEHCQKITDWDLFDGKVFQLLKLGKNCLHGNFINYRYFYTQHKYPELKEKLAITLVGVTAVLRCGNQILLAKRSEKVTQYPGKWEFAPSGGIAIDYLTDHTVDYEKQIFEELTQEVGMDEVFVESVKPLLFVRDKQDLMADIVCQMDVDRLGAESASYDSWEYTDYRWLKQDEITEFIRIYSTEVIPNVSVINNFLVE